MRFLLLATVLALTPAAESRSRTPPSPVCLDARQVAEVRQVSSHHLAVEGEDGQRFRLTLAQDCPGAAEAEAALLAPEGWACAAGSAFVRTGGAICAVSGIERIDARTYAALAREAMARSRRDLKTLETVQVRGPRRLGFAGSPSVCFNPRYLRAWAEDSKGLLVELSPRRSGGHRYYRVELAHSCSILDAAPAIVFHSGPGIGLICGNAGDRVIAQDGAGSPFESSDAGSSFPDDGRRSLRMGMRAQCSVTAVYPHELDGGKGKAPR